MRRPADLGGPGKFCRPTVEVEPGDHAPTLAVVPPTKCCTRCNSLSFRLNKTYFCELPLRLRLHWLPCIALRDCRA